jgi:hypothetical protein
MSAPKNVAAKNHPGVKIPSRAFREEFPTLGAAGLAKKYHVTERKVYERRRAVEQQEGITVASPVRGGHVQQLDRHPAAIQLGIHDGHILIGSDSHYWPGIVSTAHNAFLEFCREFKPKVVIKNGDEADFPSISKYAPIQWESRPSLIDEIEYLKQMLGEIEKVSPKARHIHTLGNHDARFETRLATVAPEYANIHGVHLKDHLPKWEPCWAALIDQHTVVKHRFKAGIHAPHNNTMWAGRTIVTGHLHSQKIMPLSDYNGTRWGVDAGTMADPYGPQFYNYTEMNPVNWRSGFCLLTIVKGRLLMPELVWVSGPGEVQFRGKIYNV